jgi:hypothetical protein
MTALKTIAALKLTRLGSETVRLLNESTNRDFQFECIRTLSALNGVHLIAWAPFYEDLQKYVSFWSRMYGPK